MLSHTLVHWFLENKRDFPWRLDRSAYRVLVSEIMLQQTQASRVVGYFHRWMEQFPTIESLAKASEHDVMKAWEGLGYYSRARSLQKAAIYITDLFQGVFPTTRDALEKIPGVGPYTSGALLAFAFRQMAPAIDANVIRVLSRVYNIAHLTSSKEFKKEIAALYDVWLINSLSVEIVEAIIEFGALVCTPLNPSCGNCPIQNHCIAYQEGVHRERPVVLKKIARTKLYRSVAVFWAKKTDRYLIFQRTGGKVMSGLYEFAYLEHEKELSHSFHPSQLWENVQFNEGSYLLRPLTPVRHSFTRYQATLMPYLCEVEEPFTVENGLDIPLWVSKEELSTYPFSSGHKKVLMQL